MELKNNKYFITKISFLRDPKYSCYDKIVYLTLISITDNKKNSCTTTYQNLAKLTSTSRSSVLRSIKYLKRNNLINIKRNTNSMTYNLI